MWTIGTLRERGVWPGVNMGVWPGVNMGVCPGVNVGVRPGLNVSVCSVRPWVWVWRGEGGYAARLGGADGAELEAVAAVGEGRGAVAVFGGHREGGDRGHPQVDGRLCGVVHSRHAATVLDLRPRVMEAAAP